MLRPQHGTSRWLLLFCACIALAATAAYLGWRAFATLHRILAHSTDADGRPLTPVVRSRTNPRPSFSSSRR